MKAVGYGLFDPPFLSRVISPATFGPVRWYDADSFEYLTNDAFITVNDPWDDVSSNNLDAVTSIGREPTKKSNWINDRNAVRMVGAKHFLLNGGDLVMGDFTILCACLCQEDSLFLSRDGLNRQIRINRNSVHVASWFSGQSGTELVSDLFTSDASKARMIGYRRSNNATAPVFHFFDNTNIVAPRLWQGATTVDSTNANFGINQIGIIDGGPLAIDIGELVIYNIALSDSQIQGLYDNYFQPKFALPLS